MISLHSSDPVAGKTHPGFSIYLIRLWPCSCFYSIDPLIPRSAFFNPFVVPSANAVSSYCTYTSDWLSALTVVWQTEACLLLLDLE